MARILYGPMVTELAGSIGGLTFQKNTSGYIVRTKPNMPVNPSPVQAAQQHKLSTLVALWPTLSSAQKTSWSDFAIAHLHVTPWGESKQINGYQWFLSCNLNLLTVGDPVILSAPAWSVVSVPSFHDIGASAGGMAANFDPHYYPGTDFVLVYVTLPLRQSSIKLRRSLFFLGVFSMTNPWNIVLGPSYAAYFNLIWADFYNSSNCTLIIRILAVQHLTGLTSPFVSQLKKIG